MHSEIN